MLVTVSPPRGDDRRKKFYPHVSLGHIIAAVAFLGSGIGVYVKLTSQMENNSVEISTLKINEIKKEAVDKEYRDTMHEYRNEAREQMRELRKDIKETQKDVQKILLELSKHK